MDIPAKLAPGKSGKPIKLISNYFSVEVPADEIYHYNLEIEHFHAYTKEQKIKIVSTMLNTDEYFKNRLVVYDGGESLFTRIALDIVRQLTCQVVLGVRKFSVYIRPTMNGFTIDLDQIHAFFSDEASSVPQEAIRPLELALRMGPLLNYFSVRNFFFYPPTNTCPLDGATNIWMGYRQSLRLGQSQLLLNLDVKGCAFYQKRPLLDYVADLLNVSQLSNNEINTGVGLNRISKELRGLKVTKGGFRIMRLTDQSAEKLNMSGLNITVADFFAKQNEPLKYPNLPCVELDRDILKSRRDFLMSHRDFLMNCGENLICPLEICEIIDQPVVNRLNDRQKSEIIKFTARSAKQRFDNIIESLNKSNEFQETYLKAFDIKIVNEPLELEGRIIDAPKLSYQKEAAVKPKDGCWNAKNQQYFRASAVYSWIVISFADCKLQHLESFAKLLFDMATEHGMRMKPVKNIYIVRRREPVKYLLNEMFQKFGADLMVVVLPGNDTKIYAEVKEFSETKPGLVTQCVKDRSVSKKCKPSVLSNLCQKINSKMGGVNAILDPEELPFLLQRPVIIIGARISHGDHTRSMRGYLETVVGSLDTHLSRYAVKHSFQTYEIRNNWRISDLKYMITDLLKVYYCNNRGNKPEKIIFFRTGVCDSQFGDVKSHEVRSIREACQALDTTYSPGITHIVLQKRHHTRFVPQDTRQGVGRMGNIPTGTVVDSDVVRPTGFDFFLCSHFVTQGTSVPRHYTILHDDNHFTADELQKLTYYLCHTYAFGTKSLSCPAPTRYAQLAAQQVQQLLRYKLEESHYHVSKDERKSVLEQLKNTTFFI